MKKSKIYINGKIIGTSDDPEDFVRSMREKRRTGEVSPEMNITYYKETDEIFLFTDPGRTRRPLIVVENGESKLTEETIQLIEDGELDWEGLINQGIIEYMDAEEEENSYIAMFPEDMIQKKSSGLRVGIKGYSPNLLIISETHAGIQMKFGFFSKNAVDGYRYELSTSIFPFFAGKRP